MVIRYPILCTMLHLQNNNAAYKFVLIDTVKSILQECGLNYVWMQQTFPNVNFVKNTVHKILLDHFMQGWKNKVENSSKGNYYKLYKPVPSLENYLLSLPNDLRIVLTQFRTSNHILPIETGRWYKIDVGNIICNLCNATLGDEYSLSLC